jgi:hypothetical protein
MTKGGGIGPFLTETAPLGAKAYAWGGGCRCTENEMTEIGWVSSNKVVDDRFCPVVEAFECGLSDDQLQDGQEDGDKDGKGKGLKGGLFPWGFGNILPETFSSPIKKLLDAILVIVIAAVGLYLLSKFIRKK